MTGGRRPLGGAVLLRVAGLPVRTWLAAAAPDLVADVERLVDAEDDLRASARDLAERIGAHLVTDAAVSRDARRHLLDLRRRLHRGTPTGADPQALPDVTSTPEAAATLRDLHGHLAAERAVAEHAARVVRAVDAEQARLAALPATLCAGSATARAVVPAALRPPPTATTTRADRRRAAHARRLLARAATVATPRGWFSHVGLLDTAVAPVDAPADVPDAAVGTSFVVGPRYAAHRTQDVRATRRATATPPDDWPHPATPLALDPLQWTDGDRVVSVVLDHHEQPVQAEVRATPVLEAVRARLRDGARTFDDLAASLGCTEPEEQAALRGFVRHLVGLGVLQAGAVPDAHLVGDATPDADTAAPEGDPAGRDGDPVWVDVYRQVTGTLAPGDVAGLPSAVALALAVLELAGLDPADPTEPADEPDEPDPARRPDLADPRAAARTALPDRDWRVVDVLAAELDARTAPDATAPGANHPAGPDPDAPDGHDAADDADARPSRLTDLLRTAARATAPGRPVVLDRATLARSGAHVAAAPTWPVDCLVRVPAADAGHGPVLEQVWPVGVLDSRFAHGLTALHGDLPHVARYGEFLHHLERLTGTTVVELLAPPLSGGASNAVRRPACTGAWTGDPHAAPYTGDPPGAYVPLDAIRLERRGGRLRAWAGPRRLWPTYHATRTLSPPWDRVAQVLLAAAPVPARVPRSLLAVLTVPAGLTSLPRVETSDGVVLAPAQWHVTAAELGDPDDAPDVRLRTLVRLRRDRGLPRWVWLVGSDDDPPVACDLASLDALDVLAHRTSPVARLVEMLPRPDALPVRDGAHDEAPVVAQLHLRLPLDATPVEVARRLAPRVRRSLDGPAPARAAHPDGTDDPRRPAVRAGDHRAGTSAGVPRSAPAARDERVRGPPADGAHTLDRPGRHPPGRAAAPCSVRTTTTR